MSTSSEVDPVLTERFGQAVTYAAHLHGRQARKGTQIPYISHLLGVAALVLEQPGATEDQAIAALLHDAIEDQGHQTDLAEIGARFGPLVAQIVGDCTDADTDPKPPWRHRKVRYLAHLETVAEASLQVSVADKLHNATAIRNDVRTYGPVLWTRFNAPPAAQHWYYTSLAEVFERRLGNDLSVALARTVEEMFEETDTTLSLPEGVDRPDWVGAATLTGAAALVEAVEETTHAPVVTIDDRAWRTEDGRWWIERADAGDPARPLAIFVAPEIRLEDQA
jgi:hypothetical protein